MNKVDRYHELDALRGLAAIFVVFHHYTMDRPQSNAFWKMAVVSVDAFIVLSGFLITMSISHSKTGEEFIRKRFFRIYPSYVVCLAITTTILIKFGFEHFNQSTLIKFISNLTIFNMYWGQANMDGVYWTLTVEMCFYLLAVIILITGQLKNLEIIGSICLAVLFTTGVLCHLFPPSDVVLKSVFYNATILILLPQFIAGTVFYKMLTEAITLRRYLMLAGCWLTILSLEQFDLRIAYVGHFQFMAGVFVVLILLLLFIKNRLNFIVNPVTLFLGKISYPLYLLHMNIGLLVLLPNIALYTGYWPAMLMSVATILLLAYCVHVLVEQPVLKWTKKMYLRRSFNFSNQLTEIETIPILIAPPLESRSEE